ncbi:MAG: AAA family ATPase [Planctomycetota bacterium]
MATWQPGQESGSPQRLGDSHRRLLEEVPRRLEGLRAALATRIIGQEETIRQLLLSFLARGHVLVIGVPGLAKTLMIRSLAQLFDLDFARIQFTPDLMPSDITGTSIIVRDEKSGRRDFRFRPGPVFTHLLLADEINRTPPKTQSALLEAMEEGQVTVAGRAWPMERPFFVLATQNPIEQEGTYPLPITQLDRFLFQIDIDYPDGMTEFEVVATTTSMPEQPMEPILSREEVLELLAIPERVEIPASIVERAARLVRATRPHEASAPATARELLSWGAGPRGVQAILTAARAAAVLAGRDRVDVRDYEQVILPALRHRILLSYHAEAEMIRPDHVITRIRREIGDAPPRRSRGEDPVEGRLSRALKAICDTTPRFRKR